MLLKKAARCQPFLAVVRCLFHNHLRLKRSSLLNVYLNYKFEISLLTSHLFFSLFILMFTTSVGYRLGFLMSTTCLNCARFYDGVKLFSFKRVISDFPTFVNYWQNQRAKTGFPKRCIFYKYTNLENLLHFVRSFNLVSIYNDFRLFLDGWGVLEDDGLLLNFLRRRLFQPTVSNSRFRSLIGWIQAIKLRKREFDRLEKIQQSYQITFCLSKMQRKNAFAIVFGFFILQKQVFFKNTQNPHAKLIFSKK